jgi:flavin reductase (DIM6/NTAB) family NADH-FMN oxidoreductase RutF
MFMFDFRIETDAVQALKETFRRHASGVSIITLTGPDGEPVGFTATSMTSLGATPPLASFNVASGSSTWPKLCAAEYVAIHTLGTSNLELAKRMAADHTQRFVSDDWSFGPHGVPILQGTTAALIAKIREIHAVENNAVVIVDILEGLVGHEEPGLLYHQRSYVEVGAQLS